MKNHLFFFRIYEKFIDKVIFKKSEFANGSLWALAGISLIIRGERSDG
jgi:hypothetical protein